MSRSYKHTAYTGLQKDRFMKRYANRKLRRKKMTNDFDHNAYKKDTNSWDICDYAEIGVSFEEFYRQAISNWLRMTSRSWFNEEKDPCPTREQLWKLYQKYYVRK